VKPWDRGEETPSTAVTVSTASSRSSWDGSDFIPKRRVSWTPDTEDFEGKAAKRKKAQFARMKQAALQKQAKAEAKAERKSSGGLLAFFQRKIKRSCSAPDMAKVATDPKEEVAEVEHRMVYYVNV
jgi:hypothetical protein